jgi:hypothetical protein
VKDATQSGANERPSVIIVEVLGYGGGSEKDQPDRDEDERLRKRSEIRKYDATSPHQVLGLGPLTDSQIVSLAAERRRQFER